MQTELVQVQNTKPPQPGSKYTNWSVWGSNDEFFVVAPQFVGQLKVGETYQLAWEQAGKARKIIGINGNALQDGPAPVGTTVANLDPVKQAEAALAAAKAEAAQKAQAAAARPQPNPLDELPPILSNVLGHYIANGNPPSGMEILATEVAKAVKAFRAEMARQSPPPVRTAEVGHGPPIEPPTDRYPDDFVQ